MKISRIEIQNYKAFRDTECFDIDSRNVLIYGNNGSGKSSFAHALQALFQSSAKTPDQIQHAFDRLNDESIVNLDTPEDGVSFVRLAADNGEIFEYSLKGNTQANAILQGANQVCDFLNYRLLFRFFSFRETQDSDIFPIFRDEFFPYWIDDRRNQSYSDWYRSLQDELDQLKIKKNRRNSRAYVTFETNLNEFNTRLQSQVQNLLDGSNAFLKVYLSPDEPIQVSFRFIRGIEPEHERKWTLAEPVIRLVVSYDGKPINRPHTFLNEARLTALALAIRIAAFESRPRKVSDFKVIVLDDLLISLDMSLRMKVIQVMLDSYQQYQLFILTHDKSFYNFLKQVFEVGDSTWKCFELYENNTKGYFDSPTLLPGKDYLTKAEEYLNKNEYEICAVYLRKKAEELIRIYFDPTLESLTRYYVLDELASALGIVSKEYTTKILTKFSSILDSQTFTQEMLQKLRAEPFRGDSTLTVQEIGQINHLRSQVLGFLEMHYAHRKENDIKRQELVNVAKEVSRLRSIVLNPGAHQGNVPLYVRELHEALDKLKAFEKKIKDKDLYS